MRKGFTLIELLAILTVLGIIILVSVPSIMDTNKKSQENDYTEYKHTVEKAAEVYLETHSEKFEKFYDVKSTNGSEVAIKSEDLVALGYIQGSLQNPKTKVKIIEEASYVEVKNNNGTLEYTYVLP